MKCLVTGSNGFLGKNLCCALQEEGHEVLPFDIDGTEEQLRDELKEADFIFHLAGVNRPLDPSEFEDGNVNFTKKLLSLMEETNCHAPIMVSSSIQAERHNPYGRSKKKEEEEVFVFASRHQNAAYVYRFPNLFGKWCRPNYNSVIATFCFNAARDIPLQVNQDSGKIGFAYVDDVVTALLRLLHGDFQGSKEIQSIESVYEKSVPELAELIRGFHEERKTNLSPDMEDPFAKKLYATYLSYLPEDQFSYPLLTHADQRGCFSEFMKENRGGQLGVNLIHPGFAKGGHYHHLKVEKYLVVQGECLTRFRRIDGGRVLEYPTSGKKLEVIDIPVGYTHEIKNVGKEDAVVLMWASESFDPEHPDTYPCPVEEKK